MVTTRDDFAEVTRSYLQRAAAARVRHLELFFDPQAHTSRSIPPATVTAGIVDVLDTTENGPTWPCVFEDFQASQALRSRSGAHRLIRRDVANGDEFVGEIAAGGRLRGELV